MPNRAPIKVNVILAARRRDDIALTLDMPAETTLATLHVDCLRALNTQAPEYAGRPITNLEYDVRANA